MHAARAQATALRLIKRWGAKGSLRRDGVDRDAWIAIIDFGSRDRDLIEMGYKRCLIAAKGLTEEPDRNADLVVFKGKVWRFAGPIRSTRPNGIPAFYECEVSYDSSSV